jgi:hypothetical protein
LKSVADAFGKLWRLSGRERRLLIQAWLLLMTVDLALRLLPLRAVMTYGLRRNMRREHASMGKPLPASRLARLVETAGRYCPAGTSCLKEALVLSWLMARRGMPATLRIGVGRQGGMFAAHAWLERDGRIILGGGGGNTYTPLWSYAVEPDRS